MNAKFIAKASAISTAIVVAYMYGFSKLLIKFNSEPKKFSAIVLGLFVLLYTGVDYGYGSFLGQFMKSEDDIKKMEGFTNMKLSEMESDYPRAETELPLQDMYPPNIPFKPSDLKYDTMWMDKPIFPAKSMKTNNIRYWDNPSNGTCTLPHQCDAFYKKIEPEKFVEPTPPAWDSGVRVNFFNINNGTQSLSNNSSNPKTAGDFQEMEKQRMMQELYETEAGLV